MMRNIICKNFLNRIFIQTKLTRCNQRHVHNIFHQDSFPSNFSQHKSLRLTHHWSNKQPRSEYRRIRKELEKVAWLSNLFNEKTKLN